jgi:invasion protein IalB
MSSSIRRSNTFRNLAGSAFVAALVLVLGSAMAVAQEGRSIMMRTVPNANPIGPGSSAPGAAPAAVGASPWVKLCPTSKPQLCFVKYEGLEPNTGMVVAAAAVRSIEGSDKQHLIVRLTTAASLVIPLGVQIKIDQDEPIQLQYAGCVSLSCEAQTELSKEMFEKMRNGKQMIVAGVNPPQKLMALPVPLTGFAQTFDGPPFDNAQYEAARRAMMEKFREKNAAAGRAQADGTVARAPSTVAAPQMALPAHQ